MGYVQGDKDCRGLFIVRQGPPQRLEPDVSEIERCWAYHQPEIDLGRQWLRESRECGVWMTFLAYGLCLEHDFIPTSPTSLWAMMQLRGMGWREIAESLGWETDYPLIRENGITKIHDLKYVVSWICHCQDVSDELPMFDWYSFEPDKACEIARNRFGGWVDDARV